MKNTILIRNAHIVNEDEVKRGDVLVADGRIQEIGHLAAAKADVLIDGTGKHLFPGVIDAQVHFRDPGLTHKADLHSETRAAVAGGVTSFIDMPNTLPNTLSLELLEEKYRLGAERSLCNYGFLLGVNRSNIHQLPNWDLSKVLAVTDDGLYFSGKGNLLADSPETLSELFSTCRALIAIHSEKEAIVEANEEQFRKQYGEDVPMGCHPRIRTEKACLEATEQAIALANKYGARLHILHLSTEAETHLFRNDIPLREKRITTEVSVHHLWFSDADYETLGARIKWNPAIKTDRDRQGLLQALVDDRIDIVTTDHAPHAIEEKLRPYFQSMSGAPMVQHSLQVMLEFYHRGKISLEKIARKMCHNVAELYGIPERGYIREGYHADLTLVDLQQPFNVSKENILYKCGWSPLEGITFRSSIAHTLVNGHLAYTNGRVDDRVRGMALRRASSQ